MSDTDLDRSRRTLHAVAELLLAGPQYRASGRIRLAVSPGGFSTIATPLLRVIGTDVVAAGRRHPIAGTARELGAALGVAAGAPEGVYGEGSGMRPDDELLLDPDAARRITDAFEAGDRALRSFAPDEEPTLWPEHFDVAIRVDDVNYGVSPGDGYLGEPYAYVGVDPVPDDAYWNAPFGRAIAMSRLGDAAALVAFFTEARAR